MRVFGLLVFAGALCVCTWNVSARADFDISPRVVSGKIVTYGFNDAPPTLTADPQRVFDFGFSNDPLDDPHSTDDPGVHALAVGSGFESSHFPDGSQMAFDILSDLRYWNGTGAVSFGNVTNGETLKLELFGSTVVGTGAGFYPGFVIDAVGPPNQPSEGLHEHLTSTLRGPNLLDPNNPAAANGIYLMAMQLKLLQSNGTTPYPGIDPSLPFYVLYDHHAEAGAIDDAVAYAQANLVPEPSTWVLASMGALALFVICRRRLCRLGQSL
jgi:hypothetical protein